MENLGLYIYLYEIYGNICDLIKISSGMIGICLFVGSVIYFVEYENILSVEKARSHLKIIKIGSVIFSVMVMMSILLPTKSTILLMISATPVSKNIIQSLNDGKLKKIDELIDLSLDKALIELSKDK